LEPLLGLFALVFGVIVLLKKDVFWLFVVIFKALLKFILQNANKNVSIHPPINLGPISNPLPKHTAPKHQRNSSKLDCSLDQPIMREIVVFALLQPSWQLHKVLCILSLQ